MNRILKETLWFCLPFIAAVITTLILTSLNLISLLINFHEAAYSIGTTDIILPLVIVYGFGIYLMRTFFLKFTNKPCNYIYLTYAILSIILMTAAIYFNEKLSIDEGWAIYPPLSAAPQKIEFYNFIANPLYLILIQFLLIALLAYTSYKIGEIAKRTI